MTGFYSPEFEGLAVDPRACRRHELEWLCLRPAKQLAYGQRQ